MSNIVILNNDKKDNLTRSEVVVIEGVSRPGIRNWCQRDVTRHHAALSAHLSRKMDCRMRTKLMMMMRLSFCRSNRFGANTNGNKDPKTKTNKQTNKQAYKQTVYLKRDDRNRKKKTSNKQSIKPSNKQINKPTNQQTNKPTNKQHN